MSEFDFDYWRDLAQHDVAGFFRAREIAIEAMISRHAPVDAARLRALQEQIDAVRVNAGSPTQATRELFSMMHDRLEAIHLRVQALQHAANELEQLKGRLVNVDIHRPYPDDKTP